MFLSSLNAAGLSFGLVKQPTTQLLTCAVASDYHRVQRRYGILAHDPITTSSREAYWWRQRLCLLKDAGT